MCCLTNVGSKDLISNKVQNQNKLGVSNYNIICDTETLLDIIKNKVSNVVLVDVRKEDDYKKGHIPTATSLPLSHLLKDDSPESIVTLMENMGISDDTYVIVYDDTFGALASRVAWTFEYVGHQNLSLLEITFSQWKQKGLPIEKKANRFPKTKHSVKINSNIYADITHVDELKSRSDSIIIDNRERLNYLTEHIPNSINMPYTMLGSQDRILRDAQDIRRFLSNRGITDDKEIITYCGSVGTLSGLAYYALKLAGLTNVRLYSNSFKEWKAKGKPKEEVKDANYWDLSAE
jgi:thiosulfate/3-mercaptopyruvate sulfurtransferase